MSSILGSNDSRDFVSEMYAWFNIDTEKVYDEGSDPETVLTKELFEEKFEEFRAYLRSRPALTNEESFTWAYHLLKRGVNLSDDFIDGMIRYCEKIGFEDGDMDYEQVYFMRLAIKDLENYKTNKIPVNINHYFNISDHYFIDSANKGKDYNKLSEEIREKIEAALGVEVKMVRSRFKPYAIVEGYIAEQFNCYQIFGITLLFNS